MSHFSVLVITDDPADVNAALQPFHEYECTGTRDQYVVEVDETEEALKTWAKKTSDVIEIDGERVSAWDDRFYREPTAEELAKIGSTRMMGTGYSSELGMSHHSKRWDGKNYSVRFRDLSGHEVIEVLTSEVMTIGEWIRDYYGREELIDGCEPEAAHDYGYFVLNTDGSLKKNVRFTNPNAKWDWFQIGGRWNGPFVHKDGTEELNQIRIGNLDLEAMTERKREDIRARYAGMMEKALRLERFSTPAEVELMIAEAEPMWRENVQIWEKWRVKEDDQRTRLWDWIRDKDSEALPVVREYVTCGLASLLHDWIKGIGWPETVPTVEHWLQMCEPLGSFACLKDGEWHQKGEMGWFGMASDEMPQEVWERRLRELLEGLDPDKWVTMVDCHI